LGSPDGYGAADGPEAEVLSVKRRTGTGPGDAAASPIVNSEEPSFGGRWTVEQLFSTMKLQLGLDSSEVRKPRSVTDHAALTVALSTWVEVWAWGKDAMLRAQSCSSTIAALRQDVVTKFILRASPRVMRSRPFARGAASLFSRATSAP